MCGINLNILLMVLWKKKTAQWLKMRGHTHIHMYGTTSGNFFIQCKNRTHLLFVLFIFVFFAWKCCIRHWSLMGFQVTSILKRKEKPTHTLFSQPNLQICQNSFLFDMDKYTIGTHYLSSVWLINNYIFIISISDNYKFGVINAI